MIVNFYFFCYNKQLHRSKINHFIGQLSFLLVVYTAAEASSTCDLINQIAILVPKIAEVKYTLIYLQEACVGQAGGS